MIHLSEITLVLGAIGGFCLGVVVTRMLPTFKNNHKATEEGTEPKK